MQRLMIASFVFLLLACRNKTSGDSATTNSSSDETPVIAAHEVQDNGSLNGQWYLQAVLPSDTATGHIPMIHFDVRKRRFSGNTGCNSMSGRFMLTDSTLAFDRNVITTRMICVGYNERAFLEDLLRTNHYRISNGLLILMADGTELSRWTRKPEKPKSMDKI